MMARHDRRQGRGRPRPETLGWNSPRAAAHTHPWMAEGFSARLLPERFD